MGSGFRGQWEFLVGLEGESEGDAWLLRLGPISWKREVFGQSFDHTVPSSFLDEKVNYKTSPKVPGVPGSQPHPLGSLLNFGQETKGTFRRSAADMKLIRNFCRICLEWQHGAESFV